MKLIELLPPAEMHTPVMFWGNGHTAETLPTNKGWRCRKMPWKSYGATVRLIGQNDKNGCATVRPLRDGYDVAIYWETPEEVSQKLAVHGGHLDARYVEVEGLCGAGLRVIEEIEKERRMMAD